MTWTELPAPGDDPFAFPPLADLFIAARTDDASPDDSEAADAEDWANISHIWDTQR